MNLYQVDAFTDQLFSGNPAGVVTDASTLSDDLMKKITREMNLSETAFVLPSQKADRRLRFFTPDGSEIPFCGHAFISAVSALTNEDSSLKNLSIETHRGVIHCEIQKQSGRIFSVCLDYPEVSLEPMTDSLESFLNSAGISPKLVDLSKPLMWDRKCQFAYFTAKSLEAMKQIQLDFEKSRKWGKDRNLIGYGAMTSEVFEKGSHLHTRSFPTPVGLVEDPFTGSMQGGVAEYARKNQLIAPDESTLTIEQGHCMGRPGKTKLLVSQFSPFRAKMVANTVIVFKTELKL